MKLALWGYCSYLSVHLCETPSPPPPLALPATRPQVHATTYYSPSPFAIPLVYKTSSSSAVKGEGESQMLGVGCSLSGGRRRGRLSSNFSSRDRRLDFADLDSGGVSLGARTHPHLDGHGRREVCRRGLLLLLVQEEEDRQQQREGDASNDTADDRDVVATAADGVLGAINIG